MGRIIIIGGGAAGMMAAIKSSEQGSEVTLIEKNHKLGRKIYITGKGRCNVTNDSDVDGLLANTAKNPYFLYSAYYTLDAKALMDFVEELGVKLKIERGNRVFPVSDKSSDIIDAFEKRLRKNGVKIMFNSEVKEILTDSGKCVGVKLKDGTVIEGDKVLVATGGLSYPSTGSTGDGYRFARTLGHNVTKLYPSLVPLRVAEQWATELQGLSLKNVELKALVKGKVVYKDFGEMLFTHFGVSGPLVLTASRFLTTEIGKDLELNIDLKPALDEKDLDKRIIRDFEKYKNKVFRNALDDLLPQKMIPTIIELSKIAPNKQVNEITKDERKGLLKLLKNLKLTVTDTIGYSSSVITTGGIEVDEIDPSTMESKIVSGLYFAGEVLDVDCFTGGFNLQVAFSTGFLAGLNL